MADFCQQCSIELFGQDYKELAGLCGPGEVASVICEGCGFIWVDQNGKCVTDCDEGHNKPDEAA